MQTLRLRIASLILPLYGIWILATVALIASRVGLIPRFAVVHWIVLSGALIGITIGVLHLLHRLYTAVAGTVRN